MSTEQERTTDQERLADLRRVVLLILLSPGSIEKQIEQILAVIADQVHQAALRKG